MDYGSLDDEEEANIMATVLVFYLAVSSFSLGVQFTKAYPDRDTFVTGLLSLFASSLPIGIGLGLTIGESNPMAEVVFNCFVAGTLIYIACHETIAEEFKKSDAKSLRYLKLLFFLLGIGLITCIPFAT